MAYASKPPSVLAASRPRLSLGNAKWTSHGSDVSFVRAGLTKNMTTGAESGAGAGAGAGTGAGAGERASFRSRQSRGSSVLSLASGEGRHSAVELKYLASRSNNTKWSGHIIDTNDRDLCPSQEDAHWSEPQPSSGGDIAEDIAESGDGPHHADRGHGVNNKSSRPRDSQAVWEHRGSNASEDSFVAGTDSDGEDGVYASRMRDTCRACCGWNWSLWSLFIATDNEHVRALLLLQTKRLWIQLLGCLPFDLLLYLLLLDQDYETRYVLGIINIFRLHKLIRLVDLHGYMARLESLLRVDDASMRVVRLFLAYVFFIHWFGCSWYAIAKHEQQEESWNTFISDDISDDDAFFWWLRSVYWASTVISTTGYGDIVPRTSWETILAILIAITGAMLLAVLVGAFTSVLSYYDAASSVFQQRRERMNHYMDYRDLPSSLRERADAYYDYVWETDGGAELGDILKELPRSLRHEVVYFHVAFILEKVPLFAGFESGFLASIINVLYPITVPPKDDIIRKGETSQDMYFIHSGHVVVYDPDSAFSNSVVNVKRILRPGAFFGELGLISQQRRSISVRCGKYDFSQLFVLSKKGIDHVMLYYPEYKDVLKQNILKHTSLYKDGNEDGFFDLMK